MTKRSPVGKPIRYEGLTSVVSRADIQAFYQAFPVKWIGARWLVPTLPAAIFVTWGIALLALGASTGAVEKVCVGIVLLLGGIGVGFGAIAVFRSADTRAVRLWRFAADNGWVYTPSAVGGWHQGMIFQLGHSRKFVSIISSPSTADTVGFELGEYTYSTGSGKNRRTYWWTYCSVDLDRNVPHMVLDSRHNNLRLFGKDITSNLPAVYKKDQVLSLEGDFNNYFTLYAPKEYKRDALYVFTPDLMALLVDTSRAYDAEVIDNKVFFYTAGSGRQASFSTPEAMYRWLQIINTVGMKVNQQTDYYADETVGNRAADVIGVNGRRLRHGVSWFAITITVIVIVVNIVIGLSGKG